MSDQGAWTPTPAKPKRVLPSTPTRIERCGNLEVHHPIKESQK